MGALAALGAAVLWATTNLILRGPILKVGGATAQAWRTVVALLIFSLVFLVARDPRDLQAIPARTVVVLLASVFLSAVLGDILQFTAIRRLGIALAMPIAASSPLLTLVVAAIFLDERLTPRAIGGALLVVAGVILVALPRRAFSEVGQAQRRALTANHWIGVGLALASAVCATGALTLTRLAITDVDILAANMFRLPFGAALCALISTAERRRPPWRVERSQIGPLCLAALIGLGSEVLYLTAIKLVGAGRTATLGASTPIFGLIGAVLFLRERPTRRNIVGTFVAFLGVALVA